MPKYVYNCGDCEGNFEIVHGMTEKQEECELCGYSGDLTRIPQMPSIQKTKQAGHLVDEFIEKNKKVFKEMAKSAREQEYES